MSEFVLLLGVIATQLAFTPDERYPQFPRNWIIANHLRMIEEDDKRLAKTLELAGGVFAYDEFNTRRWIFPGGGPAVWVREYLTQWQENRQISHGWELADWLTVPWAWVDRDHYEAEYRRDFGDAWFERGILPVPLYLRTSLDDDDLLGDPLEGVYSIVGKEGDLDYTGSAVIRRVGSGYVMQTITTYLDPQGEPHAFGSLVAVGLRDGDNMAFSWSVGKTIGATMFKVEKGGALSGRWISLPGGEVRTERLERIGPLPRARKDA